VALAVLCLINRALAIDPHRTFSQHIRDQWSAGNGFPGGKVNAFAQTADGYLWIGTAQGLYRFDGINFVTAQQLDPSFRSITNVLGLTTDSEGNLWVWMQGLILRYRKGRFEDITPELAPGSFITAMAGSVDGGVLLSNPKRGEILYGKDGFKSLASSETFLTALVIAIAQTPDGKIWIGTRSDGLFCLVNGQITSITQGLPDRKINSLLATKDGKLWIGTDSGIALWDGSSISTNHVPPSLSRIPISALMRDRDANVWVGTPLGLARLDSENVALLQTPEKKSPAEITALFEDREGDVWIGTSHGIERLRDSAFATYSVSENMGSEGMGFEDMPSENNSPIYVDSEAVNEPAVNESAKIRVLSVDDHPLVREGLAALINAQTDMCVVGQGATGAEAIKLFGELQPDVALMDVRLPDLSGIDAMITILSASPQARVIMVTSSEGDVEMERALAGGAKGYILKSMPPREVLEAIRKVHAGKKAIPPEIAEQLANHMSDETLTAREIEVLQQVAEGNRNRDIADRLFISEGTVKVHLQHIMDKLGASDRTQAITIAVRRGIIHL
jgi:DNA-binding NarL/FixJ family response regulator/streptogramin lyase